MKNIRPEIYEDAANYFLEFPMSTYGICIVLPFLLNARMVERDFFKEIYKFDAQQTNDYCSTWFFNTSEDTAANNHHRAFALLLLAELAREQQTTNQHENKETNRPRNNPILRQ